ncbi:DUF4258 domain-containing protein [Flavobacteriaceae bacterium 3-367]|uniref:DUF4258 domain-containing protein n=1 Tax=Eudoraea algarum TaxID=3417568 RepID=UPI0032846451
MAFLKRLGFYLFGLSIGLVFLVFFLKKKSEKTGAEFCYFPNCRVLKDLRSKPMFYSEEIQQQLGNQLLDSTDIASFLQEGDIDFDASDTKSKPCKTYVIETELKGKDAVMRIKNCAQKVEVEEVSF